MRQLSGRKPVASNYKPHTPVACQLADKHISALEGATFITDALAGLQAGLLTKPEIFAKTWKRQKRFTPKMDAAMREKKCAGWKEAVSKLLA